MLSQKNPLYNNKKHLSDNEDRLSRQSGRSGVSQMLRNLGPSMNSYGTFSQMTQENVDRFQQNVSMPPKVGFRSQDMTNMMNLPTSTSMRSTLNQGFSQRVPTQRQQLIDNTFESQIPDDMLTHDDYTANSIGRDQYSHLNSFSQSQWDREQPQAIPQRGAAGANYQEGKSAGQPFHNGLDRKLTHSLSDVENKEKSSHAHSISQREMHKNKNMNECFRAEDNTKGGKTNPTLEGMDSEKNMVIEEPPQAAKQSKKVGNTRKAPQKKQTMEIESNLEDARQAAEELKVSSKTVNTMTQELAVNSVSLKELGTIIGSFFGKELNRLKNYLSRSTGTNMRVIQRQIEANQKEVTAPLLRMVPQFMETMLSLGNKFIESTNAAEESKKALLGKVEKLEKCVEILEQKRQFKCSGSDAAIDSALATVEEMQSTVSKDLLRRTEKVKEIKKASQATRLSQKRTVKQNVIATRASQRIKNMKAQTQQPSDEKKTTDSFLNPTQKAIIKSSIRMMLEDD